CPRPASAPALPFLAASRESVRWHERPSGLPRTLQPSPLCQPRQSHRCVGDPAGLVHDPAADRPLAQRAPATRPGGRQVRTIRLEQPALCTNGPGRPGPPQSPSQAPFYQPQPPMPQQQPGPMPPMNTPPAAPGFFAPPSGPAFAHPAFAPATSGPTAPTPPTAQPFAPVGPPMPPAYGNPPAGPAPEPATQDASRRGKPKRRRFNFN